MNDKPRLFRDPNEITKREAEIDLPHVAPLNNWVRMLRKRLGPDATVPWFDPHDGGCEARILWLLEAPGPKATRERGGSGFISCNNNDDSAQNTWETREEAGVPRKLVVHWNAIPYYIGTDTKIRAFNQDDLAAVGPLLSELIGLLPKLQVVILGGKAARSVWRKFAPGDTKLHIIECPHPSPTNLNTRPGNRARIVEAWREALRVVNAG
ncbi:MAG: uracil-DNA glycosylase [Anaerolineales bacterium]|nr:uracil-DNA glycosylase [Anaerolineales bacterium]